MPCMSLTINLLNRGMTVSSGHVIIKKDNSNMIGNQYIL